MNFVGHHEVAARAGLDAPGRLGAMLPDFATMLGVRLRRDLLPMDVQRGVAVHHATDAVFHAHPDVRAGMHGLTSDLAARGVGRGAARSCGHVGFEMLLDATVAHPDLTGTLRDAPPVDDALGNHPEWRPMCRHLATRVAHYEDPEWVAERLFHILAARPRLAFSAEQIPIVASVLARRAPAIRATAPAVYESIRVEIGLVGEDRRGLLDRAASAGEAAFVDR